jgi:outer membrane protein OmpA-like peptidoglycan-associated protein
MRPLRVLRLRCDGYTATWPPSPVDPMTLSYRRAQVVCAILGRRSLRTAPRLVPHGRANPIASNDIEAGRAANRRVGITFTHLLQPRHARASANAPAV